MATNFNVYNPDSVVPEVNGETVTGLGETDPLRTERLDDNEFTVAVGMQGDSTFVKNLNKAGRLVIVLKQNSPHNAKFRALLNAGSIFPVNFTTSHFYRETAKGQLCMVERAPRKKFGKTETEYEWSFITPELIENDVAI